MSTIRNATFSTSGLIESVQENALLPQNQMTFTQANFIALLNVEAESRIVPYILTRDANYFLKTVQLPIVPTTSQALSTGLAGGQGPNASYQLPPDAIGKKLTNVSVVNSNGGIVSLPLLTTYQVSSPGAYSVGFWLEGDLLYLYPAQQFLNQQFIEITYPGAPLQLCDDTGSAPLGSASSAAVTAINYTTGLITLTSVPASLIVGADINFVSQTPQFRTLCAATVLTTASNQITIDPTVLMDTFQRPTVIVGDWVANLGYSPFLQMPGEARNLVVQATVVKVLRALKDSGSKEAKDDYNELLVAAEGLFTPRVNDSPKVLATYGRGIAAYRRFNGWGGFS